MNSLHGMSQEKTKKKKKRLDFTEGMFCLGSSGLGDLVTWPPIVIFGGCIFFFGKEIPATTAKKTNRWDPTLLVLPTFLLRDPPALGG